MGTRLVWKESWLDLVAQTAGVARCSIVRVGLEGSRAVGSSSQRQHVVVQVCSDNGFVLGAAVWAGFAEDLTNGVTVDVGYCVGDESEPGAETPATPAPRTGREAPELRVVAWVHVGNDTVNPFTAAPPPDAATAQASRDSTATLCLRAATDPHVDQVAS